MDVKPPAMLSHHGRYNSIGFSTGEAARRADEVSSCWRAVMLQLASPIASTHATPSLASTLALLRY
jgi:hypothetical protein